MAISGELSRADCAKRVSTLTRIFSERRARTDEPNTVGRFFERPENQSPFRKLPFEIKQPSRRGGGPLSPSTPRGNSSAGRLPSPWIEFRPDVKLDVKTGN
ncbi:hypothetical protein KM043_012924 [Ampulex compressa]|nr:hypothetical protein KM043_012924 [Ampulex compressa]